jgi:tetratricopeptide (TPR) repeat protein
MQVGIIGRCACAFLIAAYAASTWADALTDRAKRLLEQKRGQDAYELLLPQEGARAGDPEFDYLLGIAALEVGENERAVFALERVLAVQPNNHLARAEIARAYYAMGERETAKREFETVRAQQIPEGAKQTIDRFLQAIQSAESTQIAGFLEFGGGWDTNVNSATSSNQIAVPALGGSIATLDPTSTQRADSFGLVSGGVNVTQKLSSEWAIVGGVAGNAKINRNADQFDTMTLDGNLGARWTKDKEAITVGAQLQDFELDWGRYRETAGAVAQWQHSFDESHQATLFGQYAALRYPTQEIRDANRAILGLAYAQAFSGDAAPVLFASTYFGQEKQLDPTVPNLGHKPVGVRLGGQIRLGAGWAAFANASYEHRKYGGIEPGFDVAREDNQSDLGGGISYVVRPGTTLIGQVAHTENRSNIDLFQFHRTVYTASIRFNF